jgi:hypothetical protein
LGTAVSRTPPHPAQTVCIVMQSADQHVLPYCAALLILFTVSIATWRRHGQEIFQPCFFLVVRPWFRNFYPNIILNMALNSPSVWTSRMILRLWAMIPDFWYGP